MNIIDPVHRKREMLKTQKKRQFVGNALDRESSDLECRCKGWGGRTSV